MAVTLYYEELMTLSNLIVELSSEWNDALDKISASVEKIHTTDAISGEGAESMKTYMYEVHTAMTAQFKSFIQELTTKVSIFTAGCLSIDADPYAILDSDTLTKCCNDFVAFMADLDQEIAQKDVILGKISDMYDGFFLTTNIIDQYMEPIVTNAAWQRDQIDLYDPAEYSMNVTSLEAYSIAIENLLNAIVEGNVVSFENYKPGSISNLDLYNAVYAQQAEAEAYCTSDATISNYETAKDILDAANAYIAEVDARKTDAVIHFIEGAGMVVAGVACIVGTAGMATPVVVTACAVGGTTVAFGAAEITEGGFEYYYYTQGDKSSVAFNPIRDTVFCGDQESYDLAKQVSSTATDLFTLGTETYINGGVKMVTNAAGRQVMQSTADDIASDIALEIVKDQTVGIVTDAVKDEVIGQASQYYTDLISGGNLDATEEVLLNHGINEGFNKAADAADDKVNDAINTAIKWVFED